MVLLGQMANTMATMDEWMAVPHTHDDDDAMRQVGGTCRGRGGSTAPPASSPFLSFPFPFSFLSRADFTSPSSCHADTTRRPIMTMMDGQEQ